MSGWHEHFPWTSSAVQFLWPEGRARRKRWLKVAIALLLLVGLHALATAFQARRTAKAAGPFVARWGAFDLVTHGPTPVKDIENQARAVRAATEILVLPKDAPLRVLRDFSKQMGAEISPADRESLRGAVQDNAMALTLLDLAAVRDKANWDLHYARGLEVDIPPLLRLVDLAKVNAVGGHLALDDGRVDEAISAVRRGAALASSLRAEPLLIVQVVRLALIRIDLGLVRRLLGTAELRPEQIEALGAVLPRSDPRLEIQQAYVVETKALRSAVRGEEAYVFRPGRAGTTGVLQLGLVRTLLRPYLLRQERLWLELMTQRIGALDAPLYARKDPPAKPGIRSWDLLYGFYDGKAEVDRTDVAESRETLARAAVALERHRLATGHPPATLAELSPPVPVDSLTGRPYRYETDGRSWRIRSTFDVRGMHETAGLFDPVLDWSGPQAAPWTTLDFQTSQPSIKATALRQPARLSSSATRALVASLCQAQ